MTGKRISVLMVMALMVLTVSQPVVAGVGGCRGRDCASNGPVVASPTPTVLDAFSSLLPAHVAAALKAMIEKKANGNGVVQEPGDLTIDGVGGCRILGTCSCGVGGC